MSTQDRIDFLVEELNLLPHPEGGFYSETYRSTLKTPTSQGERNLATSIYFLLRSQDVSHFHRIQSDELWFWHEGSPLTVHLLNEKGYETLKLGPVSEVGHQPQQLVSAQTIFGSCVEIEDSYALVSCVVAPGFDFRDFELFTFDQLIALYPSEKEIIQKLT